MRTIQEQSTLAKNLSVIKRAKPLETETKKVKVAAYCRVSKDIEEQETSIQNQMESYDRIIREHPDWELAGIYADKGRTGTNMTRRPEFIRMIDDAKAGRIDMIIAKSASRFARNTVDLLTVTRDLKEYGCGVFFEKEKINTMSLQSEMLLTIFAAFAQEESRSISENMKRGIRQRFEIGIPKFTVIYGLKLNGKDDWGIIEEEAEVIRTMYDLILKGYGTDRIAAYLNEKGIPGPNHTGKKNDWYQNTVGAMIRNEKYTGDCKMQKYYTVDHLNHESIRNRETVVPQFYAEDHHPAIVPRDIFDDANRVLMMKDCHRGTNMYPYYGRLICPHCKKPMVRIPLLSGKIPSAWVCGGSGDAGTYKERTDCKPYWIKEPFLTNSVCKAILGLKTTKLGEEDAQMVKQVQQEIIQRETIEFSDLKTLVESMTFPDWGTLEVTWTWGKKSRVGYSVERPSDYPQPVLRHEKGHWMVGPLVVPNQGVKSAEIAIQRSIESVEGARIIPETDRHVSDCPPIVLKAGAELPEK